MNKRKDIIILGISFFILLCLMFLKIEKSMRFLLFLGMYLYIGSEVLKKSIKNTLHGNFLDENFLMSIATVGAFLLGEYHEAIEVMIFYRIGELFQDYAIEHSRDSIASLMNLAPEYATLKVGNDFIRIDPEEVSIGSIIMVKPGEKIPLDGVIEEGNSLLNKVALTGESKLQSVKCGDSVLSGCINVTDVLLVRSTKKYEESAISKVMELVESSYEKKAKTEKYITRFAKYYTPTVILLAFMLSIIPPILFHQSFYIWAYRALGFLVVSCPCALVVSIPLSFFCGIGSAAKNGILIKGGEYIEKLAKLEKIIFDKTGTLTEGDFKVTGIYSDDIEKDVLEEYIMLAECYSNHPIAISLREEYRKTLDYSRIKDYREISGMGIVSQVDGKKMYIGNENLMNQYQIDFQKCYESNGTVVYIAIDERYVGYILLSDRIKENSQKVIGKLKKLGLQNIAMFTGDEKEIAQGVASELGITEVFYELLPQDKVDCLEDVLLDRVENSFVAFVGDGINDAPVLSRADIGISMGTIGSDIAIEASDIVIMDDNILKIPYSIELSKKIMKIIHQNIIFALSIKLIVLVLMAFGIIGMQWAIFSDVGVSVLSILNAFRINKVRAYIEK